jgi:hypothetical protein
VTLITFYKVTALPSLLYGSEIRVMTKREENHIEAAEARFLRGVTGISKDALVLTNSEVKIYKKSSTCQAFRR